MTASPEDLGRPFQSVMDAAARHPLPFPHRTAEGSNISRSLTGAPHNLKLKKESPVSVLYQQSALHSAVSRERDQKKEREKQRGREERLLTAAVMHRNQLHLQMFQNINYKRIRTDVSL